MKSLNKKICDNKNCENSCERFVLVFHSRFISIIWFVTYTVTRCVLTKWEIGFYFFYFRR